jgi:hypothetical protein
MVVSIWDHDSVLRRIIIDIATPWEIQSRICEALIPVNPQLLQIIGKDCKWVNALFSCNIATDVRVLAPRVVVFSSDSHSHLKDPLNLAEWGHLSIVSID